MRVLALMKYGARAASARQRLLQYVPHLAEHGIEVSVESLFGDEHLLRLTRGERASALSTAAAYGRRLGTMLGLAARPRHDLLWVQYELFPYLPGPFERLVRATRLPVVVDYDDAIFHQYDAHRAAHVRRLLGRKLEPLLEAAAACVVGNEYLRSYVEPRCPDTTVIPTVVDATQYVPSPRPDARSGPPVIGWIGSPSTWPYLGPILEVLRGFVERGEARVRVVGAGRDAEHHRWLTSVPWSEATEIQEVQAMDVGIMPVPDDLWARGKCGYKLIQYMACGLPVVASPVGVNASIVGGGQAGHLASTPDEWEASIAGLLADVSLRAQLGARGRERVLEHYSLASQQPRLRDVLLRAADRGRRVER